MAWTKKPCYAVKISSRIIFEQAHWSYREKNLIDHKQRLRHIDSQSCKKYSDEWLQITCDKFYALACLCLDAAHLWWKWETKIWCSCRLLQVIALRKQRWHGKRRGITRVKVSPLKSLPVRWRGASVKHGPCWLPFLTEKHCTILLTRCLVFLSLKVAGWRLFFLVRQKGMTSLTDMHMQVPPTHPCSQWRRYSIPLRNIWLAAISITLMMKAMAKAQIRLLRTHVCLFFFVGWTGINTEDRGIFYSWVSRTVMMATNKCVIIYDTFSLK